MPEPVTLSVSQFVAVLNQTLEFAYPNVTVIGEIANFKVSKGKWIYFDLKDDQASVRCFGTIYVLPGPIEDGMQLQVTAAPRLHAQFGFSLQVQRIRPVGEGSIKKAAELLRATLQAEGLFDSTRKRPLPYPPQKIGLVASKESAAYVDFMKILHNRWGGMEIIHVDVQVQGEAAPEQIVRALETLNSTDDLDVIVITRGGGSADDLQAFNSEQVVRSVAASRVPTLVAIGHEVDISLAELAADQRASTPSNAAELLVPDRVTQVDIVRNDIRSLRSRLLDAIKGSQQHIDSQLRELQQRVLQIIKQQQHELHLADHMLHAYDPRAILRRGYALVYQEGDIVRSKEQIKEGAYLNLRLYDGTVGVEVIKKQKV